MSSAVPFGSSGPWGGTPRDISKSSKPHHPESITVRSTNSYGGRINGLSSHDMFARRPAERVVFVPGEIMGAKAAVRPACALFGEPGRQSENTTPAVKVGPWGGAGGTPRDISSSSKPQRLESITIRSTDSYGGRINGFSFVYVDQNGQSIPVGTWGSSTKGYEQTIMMGEGEHVTEMDGTVDDIGVTSLKLVTNTGVEYGTYGYASGKAFSIPLQRNAAAGALCFFGRSGDSLLALGVYVTPCA